MLPCNWFWQGDDLFFCIRFGLLAFCKTCRGQTDLIPDIFSCITTAGAETLAAFLLSPPPILFKPLFEDYPQLLEICISATTTRPPCPKGQKCFKLYWCQIPTLFNNRKHLVNINLGIVTEITLWCWDGWTDSAKLETEDRLFHEETCGDFAQAGGDL